MLTVTVADYEDLSEELKTQTYPDGSPFLIVEYNGEVIAFEASHPEPEDACFWRDLEWVPKMLVRAYNLGKIDALGEAYEALTKTNGS